MTRPVRLAPILALLLGGCFLGRPGQGWYARRCFGHAQTLITELEAHQETNGGYPDHLDRLPSFPLIPPRYREAFQYEVGDDGYVLRFFHGPCMNVCEYESRGSWRCHGAC